MSPFETLPPSVRSLVSVAHVAAAKARTLASIVRGPSDPQIDIEAGSPIALSAVEQARSIGHLIVAGAPPLPERGQR